MTKKRSFPLRGGLRRCAAGGGKSNAEISAAAPLCGSSLTGERRKRQSRQGGGAERSEAEGSDPSVTATGRRDSSPFRGANPFFPQWGKNSQRSTLPSRLVGAGVPDGPSPAPPLNLVILSERSETKNLNRSFAARSHDNS